MSVSNPSARAGAPNWNSWLQTPVSVTASVMSAARKRHARSMAKLTPIPTAAPPGAMYVEAVDDSETVSAGMNLRPGSADIRGGAYVTMLIAVNTASRTASGHVSVCTASHTEP